MGYVKQGADGKKYVIVKFTGKKLTVKDKPKPVLPRKPGMKFV